MQMQQLQESFKGQFGVSNPNFRNSDKEVFLNVQALEIDRISDFGYKTNKTGFEVGTSFEYLNNLNFGISTRAFYEKMETDATASVRQKKQEGDYFDTFLKFYLITIKEIKNLKQLMGIDQIIHWTYL